MQCTEHCHDQWTVYEFITAISINALCMLGLAFLYIVSQSSHTVKYIQLAHKMHVLSSQTVGISILNYVYTKLYS